VIMCLVLTPVIAFARSKTIRIESNPEGATIYVDGKKVGVTPMNLTVDGRWWYERQSAPELKAEKAGYYPDSRKILANQLNLPAIAVGICCLFPFVWAAEIPDVITFDLLPTAKQGKQAPAVPAGKQ